MTAPTTPKTFIDQLLQSRQDKIDNEKQVKIEARKANKDLLTQSMKEFFGELRRVVRGGVTIQFSPLMSEDTIERAVSQLIELPKQPEYTGGILDQYESSTECLRQARGIINTEGESDNDQAS